MDRPTCVSNTQRTTIPHSFNGPLRIRGTGYSTADDLGYSMLGALSIASRRSNRLFSCRPVADEDQMAADFVRSQNIRVHRPFYTMI